MVQKALRFVYTGAIFEFEIECIIKIQNRMERLVTFYSSALNSIGIAILGAIHFFFILLFLILSANNVYAQSVFDLKGQRVIFAPPAYSLLDNSTIQESIYTSDVLYKMEFDDKYLYGEVVSGDTVTITDVRHINQGKKKKEALLIYMNHKGNNVVYYIPFYFKSDNKQSFRAYLYGDTPPRKFGGEINWNIRTATIDNVDVVYYNVDSINAMENYLRGKDFWPVLRKNTKEEWIQQKDCPYKFLKFELKESKDNSFYNREFTTKTLHAVFLEADGDIREYELMHRKELPGLNYLSSKEQTIGDIHDSFVSIEEMKERCEKVTVNKRIFTDSIIQTFKDKEVFLEDKLIPDKINRLSYNITDREMKYGRWGTGDGYFVFRGIKVLPILNNKPYHALYAVISDSNDKEYALAISTSFFDYVLDGDLHRHKVQLKIKEEEKRRLIERKRKLNKQKEYKQILINKYGENNADFIMQGRIQMGFTKEMVRAAWGRPYDISTITNALGTVEMWMYGIGDSYVYFQNGKVTQIIE